MNTPGCLGNVFKTINEVSVEDLGVGRREEMFREFSTVMHCLGLRLDDGGPDVQIPDFVKKLAADRWRAREEKNFAESDRLRLEARNLGWAIGDAKDGYTIEKL
jgi:cysteinyl-tRNA synthetase